MTKKQRILISIGGMIGGCILCGYAYTTPLAYPVSTICIVLGIGISVGGFISLMLALK